MSYIPSDQLTPYCRRPDNDETREEISNIANKITFNELRKQGVTSEQLLHWGAPIDLAEEYEMNSTSSTIFYNCSSPWFGSMCQYQFMYDSSLSFNEIIEASRNNRKTNSDNVSISTCYQFLVGCDRGSWALCLDWREICDGKIDCMSGEDERWCETLEMNTCTNDQYRCHYGGQCIPKILAWDAGYIPDCLDGSDEVDIMNYKQRILNYDCSTVNNIFRCEERISRYPFSFPCGNGQFLLSSGLPNTVIRCSNKRDKQVTLAMFTSLDHIENLECREAFRCSLLSNRSYIRGFSSFDIAKSLEYFPGTWNKDCELISDYCSDEWLVLPKYPIMYGFFQFIYLTNRSTNEFKVNIAPDFVCFDAEKCPILLSRITPVPLIDGLTCCHISNFTTQDTIQHFYMIKEFFSGIYEECIASSNQLSCVNSSYFHCDLSLKCISNNRVQDGFKDCYHNEDELFHACDFDNSSRFKCNSSFTDSPICLMPVAIGDGSKTCSEGEDEEKQVIYNVSQHILFSSVCNNDPYASTFGMDETNCDWWPCHNSYTHCDTYWNCLNGIDELNCPNTNCSATEFQCINQNSNITYCLPSMYMFHKRIDACMESEFIRELYFDNRTYENSKYYNSFNKSRCINEDDICSTYLKTVNQHEEVCLKNQILGISVSRGSAVYKVENDNVRFCDIDHNVGKYYDSRERFLSIARLGYFPSRKYNNSVQILHETNDEKKNVTEIDVALAWYCHQGILVLFGNNNQTKRCFCPPNYFGSLCQWQSQRISLTIQLKMQTIISSTAIFQLIIMLIDEQGIIASNYEQITYIPAQKCNTKFNIYLLYPDRPKNSSINYSIRIDLFNKSTVDYWTSWYLPIPFQFLPVNRISTQLIIPQIQTNSENCILQCGEHGRCMPYSNMNNSFFCRCNEGYSGTFCNITHQCHCSNDSLCLTSSICVCPLNKFGSHCYLKRSICQSINNPCQHDGYCVPTDDRVNLYGFICFCKEGYIGDRCQYKSNQIDIHLNEKIILINSSLFIHYITAFDRVLKHEQKTILKKIPFGQNNITIYVPQLYNILFVEIFDNDYYLTILRENFIQSEYIYAEVQPNQRCLFVNNLLNDSFLQYEYLHRIKYYPFLCRQNRQLMCFYDESHMCICDSDRYSNCFEFNRTIKHDCNGKNLCNENGRCFMNNETCPTEFICVCDDCHYGRQCNFSTKGYILSLDIILGYHIKPNVVLNQQPFIVKFSIIINIIMLISGLILGLFSMITFQTKKAREVGCGNYLFATSITSICMIIVLTIKFWQLILSQTSLITNESVLFINCLLIDIILNICLALTEWFHACVAIERTFNIIKSVLYDKKKSRIIAKRIIFILIISIIITHIHDPIHRKLIYDFDGDQQRIWCFAQYSSLLSKYNTFITLFHFLAPFLINLISALLLITLAAYNRFKIELKHSLKHHFHLQFQRHKHILIGPTLLIVLHLPRLIISFISGCMRSPREPWLYLIGYFLSFVPSMCTFFVFVLPSTTYKNEFIIIIQRWIRRFRSRY